MANFLLKYSGSNYRYNGMVLLRTQLFDESFFDRLQYAQMDTAKT